MWGKGQFDLLNLFQLELSFDRSVRLSLKNDNSTEVYVFLRSSCSDLTAGTEIGSLLIDDESVTVDVVEVTQTINTHLPTPSYPANFPLEWMRGSTKSYSFIFCQKIYLFLGRYVVVSGNLD